MEARLNLRNAYLCHDDITQYAHTDGQPQLFVSHKTKKCCLNHCFKKKFMVAAGFMDYTSFYFFANQHEFLSLL